METRETVWRYAFVFVCQRGDLEVKAVLLAASLRRYLRCDYELIAAIPTPPQLWGAPRATTLDALRELGVRIEPIENPLAKNYPIANKIACLSVPTTADKIVFLDSDILCLRGFHDAARFAMQFNATPADLQTFSTDVEEWNAIYAAAGVAMPAIRMPATLSGEYGPPYFNAGFVAVRAGVGLGDAWTECAQMIFPLEALAGKQVHVDQISLAVAIHKLNLAYDVLDERYNYPVHYKPLNSRSLPFFAHYHWITILEREPVLRGLVRSLVADHPHIKPVFAMFPRWHALAHEDYPAAAPPRRAVSNFSAQPAPDLVISGIPRSGTSYLCNLLHRYSNCVILNEPAEIFAPLSNEMVPWSLAVFYRQVRADVLAGKPIRNKLHDGQISEDTLMHATVREYTPEVDGEDFVLGTKNPLAYLSRLEAIRQVMPHARIVVCVRNPFDTIASWKRSFPHLREADISETPMGMLDAPWLTAHDRAALERIRDTTDVTVRRAMWWQFLAERIVAHGGHVMVVDYTQLVTQPEAIVEEILHGYSKGHLREPIYPSAIRQSRSALTEGDLQAIRAICSQAAASLGLC